MPWKNVGKRVYKKENGKWVLHDTCESAEKAEKQVHLLRGVGHGWKPDKR